MVDILDHRGRKIDKSTLEAPQTAEIAQLHQEFENHPSRGLTPGKLAQILEAAEKGDIQAQCDLFEDMEEKDGHILAEMGKRKRALLGLPWDIEPPRNASNQEEKIADLVRETLFDIDNFEDVILDMADAIGYGFSCLEIEWETNQHIEPARIHHRPPRWFKTTSDDRNTLRLRDNSVEGQELWAAGWINHIHKAKAGYVVRTGLHRALVWPFLFKNYSVRDLAEFLEIYGLPVRLGQYPRGASPKEKATLLRAVTNMGHAAAGIIPQGMLVEFKEAAKGASDPYTAMMDWCERTQSKVILGGTLTSQADGKSSTNALGNVHNEVRHDLLIADAKQIASTLTRDLVRVICQLNGWEFNTKRCPRFVFDVTEPEDMLVYSQALPGLVSAGMQVPLSYVHEKLGIPEPENGEPVLTLVTTPEPVETEQTALKAVSKKPEPQDTIDIQTDQLAQDSAKALKKWTDQIQIKVNNANSLEALRDDLLSSYGDLSTDTLAQAMTMAFASAELSGRFDVNEGE